MSLARLLGFPRLRFSTLLLLAPAIGPTMRGVGDGLRIDFSGDDLVVGRGSRSSEIRLLLDFSVAAGDLDDLVSRLGWSPRLLAELLGAFLAFKSIIQS